MGKWAKYGRRFQDSWRNEALFKEWLTKYNDKAYCKLCKCLLRPHKSDLEKHALTLKHKSKENPIFISTEEELNGIDDDPKLNKVLTKIRSKGWKGVCVVCLRKNCKYVKSIFVKDSDGMMISDKISECSTFQIQLKMNIPNTICVRCYKDLQATYRFRKNCEKSSKTLEQCINKENLLSVNEFVEKLENFNNDRKYKKSNKALEKCIDQENSLSDNSNNSDKQERVCVPLQNANTTITIEKCQTELLPNAEQSDEDDESSIVGIFLENYDSYLISDSNASDGDASDGDANDDDARDDDASDGDAIDGDASDCNMRSDKQTLARKAVKKKRKTKIAVTNMKPVYDYVCHICGNVLKNQYSLNVHVKRHLNIKSHKCEICGKTFILSNELLHHMRTHTGEKPYECKYCDKKYSDFGSRQRHERTHTGERPFKCEICETTFSNPSSLKRHQKVHLIA